MTPRRRFLTQAARIALLPLAWRTRRVRAATDPWLTFRPAAFEVGTDSALIWVRCDAESALRVQYSANDDWSDARLSAAVTVDHASDYTAAIALSGLRPHTRYRYRVAGADGKARGSDFISGTFRTAPDASRDFAFAFSGDTHPRHKPFALFDLMRARKPDFFLHLGDTAYVDSPRSQHRPALDHYRFKHREVRSDLHLQRFLAAVPAYAIWDDHEVENDFTGAHPMIPLGRRVFREYWPIRNATSDDSSILYRSFRWTPACEFFVLDTRQYRDQGDPGPGVGRTMLGARQLGWLKRGLKESTATFKFICSSVPFHQGGVDKWGGFKAERREIVAFIRAGNIRNVVILSADLHAAGDLSDERTALTEFLVGPIGAPLQSELATSARARETARPGSYVGDAYNFGFVRIANRDGRLVLRHEVIDAGNALRYAREIVAGA